MKEFKLVEEKDGEKIYLNGEYQVNERLLPDGWKWLSFKRYDKDVIQDWRIKQEIKNLMCGEECEALELYPAESRLVDSSNQFHLFVMPKGDRFPFGYGERLVVKGHNDYNGKGGSIQRDFDQEPEDAITLEEAKRRAKNEEN